MFLIRSLHKSSATASCKLMHKGSWQKNSDQNINQSVIGEIIIVFPRHIWVTDCSFTTLPNAFRQCTISLLIIYSAIDRARREKTLDFSVNQAVADVTCDMIFSSFFARSFQPGAGG